MKNILPFIIEKWNQVFQNASSFTYQYTANLFTTEKESTNQVIVINIRVNLEYWYFWLYCSFVLIFPFREIKGKDSEFPKHQLFRDERLKVQQLYIKRKRIDIDHANPVDLAAKRSSHIILERLSWYAMQIYGYCLQQKSVTLSKERILFMEPMLMITWKEIDMSGERVIQNSLLLNVR